MKLERYIAALFAEGHINVRYKPRWHWGNSEQEMRAIAERLGKRLIVWTHISNGHGEFEFFKPGYGPRQNRKHCRILYPS